jgi:hypothetical protein
MVYLIQSQQELVKNKKLDWLMVSLLCLLGLFLSLVMGLPKLALVNFMP